MRTTINIFVMLLLCFGFTNFAQAQVLEKKVSVHYSNLTIEEVLKDISKKYNVNFSYSNNAIPLKKKVNISLDEKSLSYALAEIFKGTDISYEALGSQVVLKRQQKKSIKSKDKTPSIKDKESTIVNDSIEKVEEKQPEDFYVAKEPEVFFVEPQYTELKLLDTLDKITLRKQYLADKRKLRKQYYSKMDSLDKTGSRTAINNLDKDFKRVMRKLKNKVDAIQDSLGNVNIFKKDTVRNPGNNKDTKADSLKYKHRPAQITFVTPLGTNGLESWNVVNNISLNILAGASAGLEGFEFGGLVNVERDYVRGVQLSGLVNAVGKDVKGIQFSGLCNINGGNTQGVQLNGLCNINGGYTEGVQFSGFMNVVADSAYVVQAAGFLNLTARDCQGIQFAGFTNVVNGNMYGVQAAGFLNFASKEVEGGQIAGFLNVAGDNVLGPQVAGFMNVAPDTLRGIQVAGFLNAANEVRGSQIGFLNIADSVSGAQIGFLSFSRRGYRRIEIWGSESLYGNIAFKTGTSRFYNIFAAGASPKDSTLVWGLGYGFGTELKLSKKLLLNLDLLAYDINKDGAQWDELNLLNQLRATFGILVGKKTSIFVGPVFNVMVSNHFNSDSGKYGSYITPDWEFFNTTYNKTNVSMWLGFNAGIRF